MVGIKSGQKKLVGWLLLYVITVYYLNIMCDLNISRLSRNFKELSHFIAKEIKSQRGWMTCPFTISVDYSVDAILFECQRETINMDE